MTGTYSAMYRRSREALQQDAEEKLQRPLNIHEHNLLRSCGTLTMLESLGMTIYFAEDAADLEEKLAAMSMESRFNLAVKETTDHLMKLIGRPLTGDERQQLHALGNIEELWNLEETVAAASPDSRQATLRTLLEKTLRYQEVAY